MTPDVSLPEPRRPARLEKIGRYRILDRLGKGAMGVVYSARDDKMERDVAIKVMMTDLESEPEIRTRFLREAQVAAQLSHPNIVTIFDVGEDDGRLFIVMELLHGVTLSTCLKEQTLTFEQKIDVMVQVCEGLTVAGAAGVCHRDIKPGNLFMQTDGMVKILDFGIARLASSSMTASGFIVGTPDFMSPEQARGSTVDERSDIFSVGAVLYLLLTGRKPFLAPDLPAVLHRVVHDEPTPLTELEAPPILAKIVGKAMTKSPTARYQQFGELTSDIVRFRRRYEAETRAKAGEAFDRYEEVARLHKEEHELASALGATDDGDENRLSSDIAAMHPLLRQEGIAALKEHPIPRAVVDAVTVSVQQRRLDVESRLTRLRSANDLMAAGLRARNAGDVRQALQRFEEAILQHSSPVIEEHIQRCRELAGVQQKLDDQARALLAQAEEERREGRAQAALSLAIDAEKVLPGMAEATQLVETIREEISRLAADRRAEAERCLDKARWALTKDSLDEADEQLRLARGLDPDYPPIAILSGRITSARKARADAEAVSREVARGMASARASFEEGRHAEAVASLGELADRYPDAANVRSEHARLVAEQQRIESAQEVRLAAERLAAEAEAAWSKRDVEEALRLAERALAIEPSNEIGIRISSRARAHAREAAERAAREARARDLLVRARTELDEDRLDEALSDAREAVDLDPNNDAAATLIALVLRRQAGSADEQVRKDHVSARVKSAHDRLSEARQALQNGELERARHLANLASLGDPDQTGAREVLAAVAAARARAVEHEDDTVTADLPAPDGGARGRGRSTWLDLQALATGSESVPARARRALQGAVAWLGRQWAGRSPTPSGKSDETRTQR